MPETLEVARTVASHLFATEEAIDAAIARVAGLVGYMPIARQEARVSAAIGQDALVKVIATMAMLGEARARIVEAHQALAESGVRARVPARNFGGFVDKPCHRAQVELRAVADRHAA